MALIYSKAGTDDAITDAVEALTPAAIGAASAAALSAHASATNNPHSVTAAQTGAATAGDLAAHTGNTSNPHSVTKAQVGLANVDNTSDAAKPISTATQAALDAKADDATTLAGYGIADALTAAQIAATYATIASLAAHTSATNNPHGVTAAQVGLGSVANYAIASQAEAEAGAANDKYMTPLRAAQAIAALGGGGGGGDVYLASNNIFTGATQRIAPVSGTAALWLRGGGATGDAAGIYSDDPQNLYVRGDFIRLVDNSGTILVRAAGAWSVSPGFGFNASGSSIGLAEEILNLYADERVYFGGTTPGVRAFVGRLGSYEGQTFERKSSTGDWRYAAQLAVEWADSTDATRRARVRLTALDSDDTPREALRWEATGSAAAIGFLGATAVTRPTVTGSRGGNAALASLLTAFANLGLITDSTS